MSQTTEEPTIGVYSGEPMVFRNGCWGEDIPEPRDLTSGEFLQLVKEAAGIGSWPEFLTLRQSRLCACQDQADLMRIDGRPLACGPLGSRTIWSRSFRRRYLDGMTRETAAGTPLKLSQVSHEIRQSAQHLAASIRKEIECEIERESKEASDASTT